MSPERSPRRKDKQHLSECGWTSGNWRGHPGRGAQALREGVVRITEVMRHESRKRYLGVAGYKWEGTMGGGRREGGIKQNEASRKCQHEPCCIVRYLKTNLKK